MNVKKESYCFLQPENAGLQCEGPKQCDKCGWNPDVQKTRHEKLMQKLIQKLSADE